MNFPSYFLKPMEITKNLVEAMGIMPKEVYIGRDILCILNDEDSVKNIKPNLEKLKELDGLLLHVSALGNEVDCISRTFAPKLNVVEDPVCGSGHCHIIPYWAEKLKKKNLIAYQASERGGTLYCSIDNDRVILGGRAVLYSIAELKIDINNIYV
ncbi:PhzF family phenazine biosynthesis protein [uncultured Fusobacterium sp.]|uniref:PhzF family phenazine biosynthesis protein n=1 Tax=uncultured Fusobacterium sp. TaxID=159267 RepID=UPI0027DB0F1F|nr:PhzF family phenazine biosynthesis protein [uncultured Fusobacterium sp.]